ncbi:MAG: hypothetical protein JXB49_33860 [Bacteroidales bacterium]|nr:hypothetical protein [Bacteroidales bacterium]
MSILLITYDLHKPGQNYDDFYKVIKQYTWARLSESSYVIDTNNTPSEIYNQLSPHMDKNDQMYIITLKNPFISYGPKPINDWLSQRLPL